MSKKMLVVSPRDFVLISHFHRHPDGNVTITVFSDDQYQHLRPEDKNRAIRGGCHIGGWYYQKLSETQTRATLILELDLKGSLPQWVIKAANTEQGSQLFKLPE